MNGLSDRGSIPLRSTKEDSIAWRSSAVFLLVFCLLIYYNKETKSRGGVHMLEVRNLTKIYKTKSSEDVHALAGVTLKFPEKGMVFMLGKSGSGKSTLLNVCGGLDAPTEGEILIKGRSSKDFSQSDFDSYRNTYVGFIFQEYNILNEFSVEDNISLALELQGKSKDKKAVEALLEQVDLNGLGKRKPNTLSGGQKQRIAIARALVKSPEIIMADEPSGALDSNTGKQVFETLKKLSQDKLVLVVSHDREFAEQYGDRIIELKDGKVISDVSKTSEQQKELSENIHTVGNVLCVKKGTNLCDSDYEIIREFLANSESDIIIANNEKDVNSFKKVNRITDAGEKEVFLDTDDSEISKKEYSAEESRFIRSKLPAKHAIRIGMSSLKSKPVRLFFTIILCTIAFTLFGLLSTMSFYDTEATFKETMRNMQQNMLRLEKKYLAKETVYQNGEESYEYDNVYEARFSEKDIKDMQETFGADTFGGVRVYYEYNIRSSNGSYWVNDVMSAAYLPENNSLREKINGSYPEANDEICISNYIADVIIQCKSYDDKGEVLDASTHEELLGKKISIGGVFYKIVGILDCGEISEKYEELKSPENENGQLQYELETELRDGLHMVMFVNEERIAMIAKENVPYRGENLLTYRNVAVTFKNQKGEYKYPNWSNAVYQSREGLTDDQMMLSKDLYCQLLMEKYNEKIEELNNKDRWEEAEKHYKTLELCSQVQMGGIWKENSETKKSELVKFSNEELVQKVNSLFAKAQEDGIMTHVGAQLFNHSTESVYGTQREAQIVGVVTDYDNRNGEQIFVSDAVMEDWWNEQKVNVDYYSITSTNYQDEKDAVYGTLYIPYDHSEAQTQMFWEMYKNEGYGEDGSRIKPTSTFVNSLEMVDSMVKSLSTVFLYAGLVLAIFAALLLSNFISVSISQKKREIGILRAVGARSLDVFKIFFSESFAITIICILLATFASALICNILNSTVATEIGAALFVFGAMSFIILVAIAIVTTVIATFLPVWNAAKKKPVDSIRAL